MPQKLISVVCGCLNEEGNLPELYERIVKVFDRLPNYEFELVVADNDSSDRSRDVLRELGVKDRRVKAVFNTRNFGPERSGANVIMQASGAAVVCMASDLQNPPEMIEEFIRHWEKGYKVVAAIKSKTDETFIFQLARKFYYDLVHAIAHTAPLKNFTGFGLYDREVIEQVRRVGDSDPFFRGLIAEFGYKVYPIQFEQPARTRGFSKYNILSLVDHGILGLISQTRVPLRVATLFGFASAVASFLLGLWYLAYKLLFWREFSLGVAPIVVGFFFFSSVQLFFVGIVGEYVGAIYTKVSNRPLVVEEERVNLPTRKE